jgi:hypothetical protein
MQLRLNRTHERHDWKIKREGVGNQKKQTQKKKSQASHVDMYTPEREKKIYRERKSEKIPGWAGWAGCAWVFYFVYHLNRYIATCFRHRHCSTSINCGQVERHALHLQPLVLHP